MSEEKVWSIDRYARFINQKSGSNGLWKQHNDTAASIFLTVTDHQHLVLSQGTVVLECFNLMLNGPSLRGLAKTDSLLILHRCQEQTRRCRMRFKPRLNKTGSQACEDCVKELSRFFVIKANPTTTDPSVKFPPPRDSTVMSTEHQSDSTVSVDKLQIKDKPNGNNEAENVLEMRTHDVTFGQIAQALAEP